MYSVKHKDKYCIISFCTLPNTVQYRLQVRLSSFCNLTNKEVRISSFCTLPYIQLYIGEDKQLLYSVNYKGTIRLSSFGTLSNTGV